MSAETSSAAGARRPMVAGNWKMNGDFAANASLLAGLGKNIGAAVTASVDVAACPPFVYIAQAHEPLKVAGIALGAQDCAAFENGAYTGEVSAAMLADVDCGWVILGHSERRALLGDTDDKIATKVALARAAGLGVMLCIGESLEEREGNRTEAVLGAQIDAVASELAQFAPGRAVVAYEPVWAIGTGRTASPEMAQETHAFVRARLAARGVDAAGMRILYGGSVKPGNAAELFAQPDIDGGLIGGASLSADDFAAICRAAIA